MNIQTQKHNNKLVITPEVNRLDISNAKEFKNLITSVIEEGEKNLVLDLSQVEFMDSTALGVIASLFKKLKEVNGELELCSLSPLVNELFDITRLNTIIKIHNTKEEALNH
jgi:anti-anti-sigma factor